MKKREGVPAPLSLNSFVSCGLSLLIGFPRADTEKSGETIATPPKRGFLPAPIAALCNMPLSRPQGVANRRYLSLREGSEQPLCEGSSGFGFQVFTLNRMVLVLGFFDPVIYPQTRRSYYLFCTTCSYYL